MPRQAGPWSTLDDAAVDLVVVLTALVIVRKVACSWVRSFRRIPRPAIVDGAVNSWGWRPG
jgi:hypothetical protein